MQGIRSYMGWSHIPDIDSAMASSEDNPFAAQKQQPAGKISVQLPTDDWLCRKMDRLNLTLRHKDTLLRALMLVDFNVTSLLNRPNHKGSGTAYTLTRINRPVPSRPGIVTLLE